MRPFVAVIIASVSMLIGACSDNNGQQTLVADNAALGTQISDIRGTATYARDYLAITQEYIETAVNQVTQQYGDLVATLKSVGLDPTTLAQITPDAVIVTATPFPQVNVTQPQSTPEVVSTPLELVTAIVPTETPGEAQLYNPVMAEGVGDNDCALASTTSFLAISPKIYVVATAANIVPGMVLGSQWFRDGTQVVAHDFN